MSGRGPIRVGVGGWTFEPWRGVFYPEGLTQKNELAYASRRLTAIEINGTYYGSQKPESWRKWFAETPDDFVFSVKGSRFTTNRKVLAEAGESIARFFDQGILELGPKLGPVLWQFANTKKFDEADFGAFLELLPRQIGGQVIRHCVEVRHDSFSTLADVTGDFVYARLQTGSDDIETAYAPKDLDAWAERLKTWAEGGRPADLSCADPDHKPVKAPREVFAYIIHEGKVRAPAGAMALIERVKA